jgi:hypothetical protein
MFPTTKTVFLHSPMNAGKLFWSLEEDLLLYTPPRRNSLLVPGRRPLTFSHARKVFWSLEQDMFKDGGSKILLPEARKLFRHGQGKNKHQTQAICCDIMMLGRQ